MSTESKNLTKGSLAPEAATPTPPTAEVATTAAPRPPVKRPQAKPPVKVATKARPAQPAKQEIPPIPPLILPVPTRPKRNPFRSLFWVVLLTLIVSGVYFGVVASDQYVGRAKFAIRASSATRMEGLSFLGLGGGSGTTNDMFIVREYVGSRQLLEDIKPSVDLRKIYSNPNADWFSRAADDLTEEEFLEYWRKMATVHYDATTGLAELRIQAFTPEEAKLITSEVLRLSEELVNRISDRSRRDTLALSQAEVDAAHKRVITALDMLQTFSSEAQQIDPVGFAKLRSEIQARLEGELVNYRSQLDVLRKSLPEDAPGIQALKTLISVTESQLASEKTAATRQDGGGDSASEILNSYSRLHIEREFAEKAYLSSLASLESARIEVLRQARYLEAFVLPQLPEYPEYPMRLRGVLLSVISAVLIWAMLSLIIAAAKEHV